MYASRPGIIMKTWSSTMVFMWLFDSMVCHYCPKKALRWSHRLQSTNWSSLSVLLPTHLSKQKKEGTKVMENTMQCVWRRCWCHTLDDALVRGGAIAASFQPRAHGLRSPWAAALAKVIAYPSRQPFSEFSDTPFLRAELSNMSSPV
jgi:hypothetical protein